MVFCKWLVGSKNNKKSHKKQKNGFSTLFIFRLKRRFQPRPKFGASKNLSPLY